MHLTITIIIIIIIIIIIYFRVDVKLNQKSQVQTISEHSQWASNSASLGGDGRRHTRFAVEVQYHQS
jgi:hypothetical protein